MNNSFLTAAASYYGLNPDTVLGDFGNQDGSLVFTFTIMATDDDLSGILSRMKVMREEEEQRQPEPESNQWSHKDVEQCRAEYNAMTAAQKSQFGSYSRYQAYRMMGNDAPESIPEHGRIGKLGGIEVGVWLRNIELTPHQRFDGVPVATSPDGKLSLIRFEHMSDKQKVGRPKAPSSQPNTDASLNRKVEHINAPEANEPVSMDAVWIDEVDATDAQRQFAVDMCRHRGLLVQWAMLTEEQKAQVAARSGGLPG